LPLQHINVPAAGRHCMPQAPPSNVMLHGARRNQAGVPSHGYRRSCSPTDRSQGQATANPAQKTLRPPLAEVHSRQMQPGYRRACSPSKRSQVHATANPAQETLQPPPLLRNENRAERTRDRLDIRSAAPSIGAQDTAKAGMMAAERAAAIAVACATTVEAQAASATAACSHVSPAPSAQRKPLRPIRPKNVEMDSNDPWWGQRSLIDKAQYAHMQHQNGPYRDDLSKAKSSDENFYQDRINSKQALMDHHKELLIRLKGSNYQNRNLKPYGSENPAFNMNKSGRNKTQGISFTVNS
jgi:hypothetical protein